MATTENQQVQSFGLLLVLAIITMVFGIITICFPSLFWRFMDIILGFFLIIAGISAIINTFKNQNIQFIRFLFVFGVLITILGFLLIFSRSQFVGTLMIWIFALWALLRGIILIFFSMVNKENQNFWRAILGLGVLLFILGIVIICSPKSEARTLAGICIGISTLFDGITLLFFSVKVKNNPGLQADLVNQANQNEIAQGSVVISETTVTTQVVTTQPTVEPAPAVQPAPVVEQPSPVVEQPAPVVEQPSPAVEQPSPAVEQPSPAAQPAPVVEQPAPVVEQPAPVVEQPATETNENQPNNQQ